MIEDDYEVGCACGARWRVRLAADDEDLMANPNRVRKADVCSL